MTNFHVLWSYNCALKGFLLPAVWIEGAMNFIDLRVLWAHSMQQISFTSNFFQIFSLEFNFSDLPTRIRVTCPSHDQTMIIIGWTKPRFLPIIDEVLITDSVIAWYPVRFARLWLWWEAQRLNSSENVWKELDVNEIRFHSEVNLELSSPVLPGCKWELSTQNCTFID